MVNLVLGAFSSHLSAASHNENAISLGLSLISSCFAAMSWLEVEVHAN